MPLFTPKQLEAIDVARLGSDACIVAGPGSGKTTVLVERYRQLVTESKIPAHAILAITFTEKAASNMKTRLAQDPELQPLLERAWVSTVHGFCLRLIRENAIAAGVDPNVSILQEGQGALLQKRCLTEALDTMLAQQPEAALRMMSALANPHADLLGVYDAIRSAGVPLHDLRAQPSLACSASVPGIRALVDTIRQARCNTANQRTKLAALIAFGDGLAVWPDCKRTLDYLERVEYKAHSSDSFKEQGQQIKQQVEELKNAAISSLYEHERATLLDVLDRFEQLYAARKRERNVLDFSDLESYAVRLLQTEPEIKARTREQFRQILMDEFQDTNGQQSKLLDLLRARDRFYAVGDINQSIFGFRHASPEVFRSYRDTVRDAGKHHVELLENWRSRPEILLATETILRDAEGIEHRKLHAGRKVAVKKAPSIEVIAAQSDSTMLEARWVARRIRELHGTLRIEVKGEQRTAEFRDITVLVRNSGVYEDFAAAFEAEEIPYEQSRRKGFFETREAMDLLHLLRVVANPRDEISLAAVLRSPFVSVSDEALLRLKLISENLADGLDHLEDGPFDETDRVKLLTFRGDLRAWRESHPYISLDRLLMRAMDASGYPWDPRKAAGANIEKFLEMARTSEVSLADFLEEIELLRKSDKAEAEPPVETERNAVRMMTAHSAKGLEFPIVFIAALHKGVDGSKGAFSFTPQFGLGAAWIHPSSGKPVPDSIHNANQLAIQQKEKQEANRLLYVALTRAEEHLVLSYTREENRRPSHWASIVAPLFIGDSSADGVARDTWIVAPSGESFRARVLYTAVPPSMAQQGLGFDSPDDIPELRRPVAAGQHDNAVTVTAVALFAKDPQLYYKERYLGWTAKPRARLADIEADLNSNAAHVPASELGSQVHELLAGADVESADPRALELASVFRESELGRQAERALRTEREFAFLVEVGGIIVRGQIDLWFQDANELIIVDYKTDDIESHEAGARALDYEMQIHLYALVLERLTGRPVTGAYIHFLRCDQVVRLSPDVHAAAEAVARLAQAQQNWLS